MSYFWKKVNSVEYIYADYRLLTQKQIINQLEELVLLAQNHKKTPIPILANFDNVPVSSKLLSETSELGKIVVKENLFNTAIIGIKGYRRIILDIYIMLTNDNLKSFDNEEDAVHYLTNGIAANSSS